MDVKARLKEPTIPDPDDDQDTSPDSNNGQDNKRQDLIYDPKK
ncbi:5234_t:CDS:2, partial [Acaulospora colombiana]